MNVLTILRSVEELLYEVISWLLFYPRTLLKTLLGPLKIMSYSDREQADKPEKQYLETLSPPLFLVLSILVSHIVELAFGFDIPTETNEIGEVVTSSDQTLLAFRALLFSMYAVVFAWLALRLAGKRIDREILRAPFFAQCYLSGAIAILTGLATTAMRYDQGFSRQAGLVVMGLVAVWYLAVQTAWLRRECGLDLVKAGAFATVAAIGATILVILIGYVAAAPS
ncbi:hypothetical protein [Brevundimonas lutea]|uniref:hypothetical protein n=1 Tax=Brevundimonas lutea TaxID=2293980 RepID=UPI000F01180E|nr:hypothetical protein [Brevundimonas lutea]